MKGNMKKRKQLIIMALKILQLTRHETKKQVCFNQFIKNDIIFQFVVVDPIQ